MFWIPRGNVVWQITSDDGLLDVTRSVGAQGQYYHWECLDPKNVFLDFPWRLDSATSRLEFDSLGGSIHARFPQVIIPICFAIAAPTLASMPFMWNAFRRRRNARSNRCLDCGYSIIGNISAVCPECGAALTPLPGATRGQA